MNKRLLFVFAITVLCAALTSCGGKEPLGPQKPPVQEEIKLTRGTADSLIYVGYAPLSQKSIKLHYYIPATGDITRMRILFAMHGADRNGKYQITTWKKYADDAGFILLAPEYDKTQWSEAYYQFGNISSSRYEYFPVDKEKWTYNTIEAIFDEVKKATGNIAEKYDIWGHSAGGQFVHRFMFYMPNARVATAIASNPGSYTFPQLAGIKDENGKTYNWPYSLKGTSFTEADIKHYLACNLYVHLGTADLVQDSYFPTQDGAMAQGDSRYARGQLFYNSSKALAEQLNTPFNWKKKEVTGVGHDSRGMAQKGPNAAAVILGY